MRVRLFRFKQFSVCHQNSAMKIGVDAVLLGAWIDVNNCNTFLDVGCGCGVISLMIAQRSQDCRYGIQYADYAYGKRRKWRQTYP